MAFRVYMSTPSWFRRSSFAGVALVFAAAGLRAQTPTVRFLPPVASDSQPAVDEFGLGYPTADRLFRLESEQAFRDRLAQELPKVKNVRFPMDVPLISWARPAEPFPEMRVAPVIFPICYRPLYFEDKRTGRFGQYVPYLQPVISLSRFYADVLLLPIHVVTTPPWTFECDNR